MHVMKYRIERDSQGKREIPKEAYFGINTFRSLESFQISERFPDKELFYAIAEIKLAAAKTNLQLKLLRKSDAIAIMKACQEIIEGKLDDEFLIDAYHSSNGEDLHTNINEVIANRAIEILQGKRGDYTLIHPSDHLNLGQAPDNVLQTAIKIASVKKLIRLTKALESFQKKLRIKNSQPKDFNLIKKDIQNIQETSLFLTRLNLSTENSGINTYLGFSKKSIINLKKINGINWKQARRPIQPTQNTTELLEVLNILRTAAINITNTINKLYCKNPDLKIAKTLKIACYQVIGYEHASSIGAQTEQLKLESVTPLVTHNLLESIEILTNSINSFIKNS